MGGQSPIMSIQPRYSCLSLRVVVVGEVVQGILLQGLGKGDSAGRVRLDDEQSYMHPI